MPRFNKKEGESSNKSVVVGPKDGHMGIETGFEVLIQWFDMCE